MVTAWEEPAEVLHLVSGEAACPRKWKGHGLRAEHEMRAAGLCSPRVALVTHISVGRDSLPALFLQ